MIQLKDRLVTTLDGSASLVHPDLNELYHSQEGALWQAQNLYLGVSKLAQKFSTQEKVSILDVGFGLGYNALATISLWLQGNGSAQTTMLTLEKDLELFLAILNAQDPWQCSHSVAWKAILNALKSDDSKDFQAVFSHPQTGKTFSWNICIGDAYVILKSQPKNAPFNIIYQDPFSPKKNPELWSEKWFQCLSSLTSQGGVLVSYSVASLVRQNLNSSGFSCEKVACPGPKKAWLRAIKD